MFPSLNSGQFFGKKEFQIEHLNHRMDRSERIKLMNSRRCKAIKCDDDSLKFVADIVKPEIELNSNDKLNRLVCISDHGKKPLPICPISVQRREKLRQLDPTNESASSPF